MDPVDAADLNFNTTTLTILNVLIGLIMFGVALSIRVEDSGGSCVTPVDH